MSEHDIPERNSIESVSEDLYSLSFDLYKILSKQDSNLFFSPFCVELLLYIASMGGKGMAEEEVMNYFNLPTDNSLTDKYFSELIKELQSMELIKLQMVNKMFVDSSFQMKDKFKLTAGLFSVEADEVDFMTNTEACTDMINTWVEEKTNPIMKEAIPHGIFNSRTSLLLLSAMHFKGKWEFPFDSVNTQTFFLTRTIKKDVEMMEVTRKFRYAVWFKVGAQFLEVPYMGGQLSMLLILPTRKEGLSSTLRCLRNVSLDYIIHKMYRKEVILSLPRFTLEQTLDLSDTLLKLGIVSIFEDGKTDFSGIAEKPSSLVLSNVIQKNCIEVNEEGTENAPVLKSNIGPYRSQSLFNANHPFVFFIIHPKTSFILYMGKYSDPDNMKVVSLNKELPIPYVPPSNNKLSCSIN